ncbi:MAG: DNA repair protein RecN [Rhodospirillales bacterium]|nr:MAG: DNA repair protein RecN [Rhodospirillales bacterium]
MLLGLSIRDFVLIEKLDIGFPQPVRGGARGLAALTGETGAGKSILLDAFSLALGGRVAPGVVRAGAAQATVAAEFALAPDHPAHAILAEQGVAPEGAALVLRRVVGADGRGRAFVNDQPASVALLKRLGETLVEIQGQFEQHGLLVPVNHRATLDAFAGLRKEAAAVAAAWDVWRAAEAARAEAALAFEQAQREEEYLRHAVAELVKLDPRADDEERLAAERQLLRHGAAVGEAVAAALDELERDKGASAALRAAHRAIERNATQAGGRLDAALAALDRAQSETAEAAAQLEQARDALDGDPARLDGVEERLFALRAAARKHGVPVAGLAGLRARLSEQLAALDDGDARQRELAAAARKAREAFTVAAETLSAGRGKGAVKLDKAVGGELAPLKLERAKFTTRIERQLEKDWGAHGIDRVDFLVSTNPGAPPASIGRIASGGELSRFMLALKVALAKVGDARTLVFDEVDSGIGGATAAAVGERLRRLARDLQVLVVTHSPQVAALADHHWLIRKTARKDRAATEVVPLDDAARLEEVARMLSGAKVTDAARAAATQLLAARG